MPITRAKASQLLNQKEMALYDESRLNGLRQLDGKAISTRITRARAARDRARDLVRRQKLSSRAATGSKRGASGVANQRSKDKAELMADILLRFETRLREVGRQEGGARPGHTAPTAAASKRVAKKAAKTSSTKGTKKATESPAKPATGTGRKSATRKTAPRVGKKAATKPATTRATNKATKKTVTPRTARKATSKKPATGIGSAATATPRTRQAAKKPTTGQAKSATTRSTGTTAAARRGGANDIVASRGKAAAGSAPPKGGRAAPGAASGRAGTPRSRPRKRGITPEQALAQTQALLEAKQARDQAPKPWADAVDGSVDPGTPGYQSDSAARRAKRLHAAEVRLPAIQGSVSTRGRINQGKRDHRGDTGE